MLETGVARMKTCLTKIRKKVLIIKNNYICPEVTLQGMITYTIHMSLQV